MDVELIEEQDVDVRQEHIHRVLDGCSIRGTGTAGPGVEPSEEIMKVDATFPGAEPVVETVHEPRFAATHRSVKIDTSRRPSLTRSTAGRYLCTKGRQPLRCFMLAGLKLETQQSGVVRDALHERQDSFPVALSSPLRESSTLREAPRLREEWGRHSQPFRLKMRYMSSAAPNMRPMAMG
ncbi:hypothetical protein StoSoilB13_15800 [Arthrobacter sp. StoSoilB13]|nr:hypothetical protein StoSoilB13_15800 [Arthrobacter sp. StoSoilB13]